MQLLIFDLDGTLVDSKIDLANSVNATRAYMGMGPLENERVYSYVGNGAPVLLRRAMGPEMPQEEVDRALGYFLKYYGEHKLDFTRLYPGVREALDRFRDRGLRMAVLTNKPVKASQGIIDGLGVSEHFFRVYGGNSFERKKPDPIGIERLMEESGVGADGTLMIGDSSVDIQTARNAKVACAGVTWGFQPEGLKEDPPDVVVDRMEELTDWILARE
jgi:phosphoglycolate phosphatase